MRSLFLFSSNPNKIFICTPILDSCVSPPTCQHGGFVDKTCSCSCPAVLMGTVCQQLVPSTGM